MFIIKAVVLRAKDHLRWNAGPVKEEDVMYNHVLPFLENSKDNCGRMVIPQIGTYDNFSVSELLDATPNEKCREHQWFVSKANHRIIASKDVIFFNKPGNAESYGTLMRLDVQKFNEYFATHKSFNVRPCDYKIIIKNIYRDLYDLSVRA